MTTAYSTDELLGIGIYSPSEAAMYARVRTASLTRWILGTSQNRPAVRSKLAADRNEAKWVTFLDFVQAMAIRDIRLTKRVHLDQIRETIETAESKFGIKYPFARKHTTFLLGNHISLNIKGYGLVDVTGLHKSQLNIPEVVEQYLEDLSFDAEGLASGYSPFSWGGYSIVFNPHMHFGEPLVVRSPKTKGPNCRYTVATLCNAFEAEGSLSGAAKAYGVAEDAVKAARKYYFDYLRPSEAA